MNECLVGETGDSAGSFFLHQAGIQFEKDFHDGAPGACLRITPAGTRACYPPKLLTEVEPPHTNISLNPVRTSPAQTNDRLMRAIGMLKNKYLPKSFCNFSNHDEPAIHPN